MQVKWKKSLKLFPNFVPPLQRMSTRELYVEEASSADFLRLATVLVPSGCHCGTSTARTPSQGMDSSSVVQEDRHVKPSVPESHHSSLPSYDFMNSYLVSPVMSFATDTKGKRKREASGALDDSEPHQSWPMHTNIPDFNPGQITSQDSYTDQLTPSFGTDFLEKMAMVITTTDMSQWQDLLSWMEQMMRLEVERLKLVLRMMDMSFRFMNVPPHFTDALGKAGPPHGQSDYGMNYGMMGIMKDRLMPTGGFVPQITNMQDFNLGQEVPLEGRTNIRSHENEVDPEHPDDLTAPIATPVVNYFLHKTWKDSSCVVPPIIGHTLANYSLIRDHLQVTSLTGEDDDIATLGGALVVGVCNCQVADLDNALRDGRLAKIVTACIKVARLMKDHLRHMNQVCYIDCTQDSRGSHIGKCILLVGCPLADP